MFTTHEVKIFSNLHSINTLYPKIIPKILDIYKKSYYLYTIVTINIKEGAKPTPAIRLGVH